MSRYFHPRALINRSVTNPPGGCQPTDPPHKAQVLLQPGKAGQGAATPPADVRLPAGVFFLPYPVISSFLVFRLQSSSIAGGWNIFVLTFSVLVPEVAAQWAPLPSAGFSWPRGPGSAGGTKPPRAVTGLRPPGRLPRRVCDLAAD